MPGVEADIAYTHGTCSEVTTMSEEAEYTRHDDR